MNQFTTEGKTRSEFRNEIREVEREFNELMEAYMTSPDNIDEINERLIILDGLLGEMESAWRRMKRK